jgi:peptidoglycan hydrolase-like protein with peptidoglycan-binding domain
VTRERVVEIAAAEVGGSLPGKYWLDVLEPSWRGPYPKHWCGAFALWCLQQAGLIDWRWEVGKGFLWRLSRTTDPQPGDIGYLDQPFQHHYVVERADKHTLTSIDGNQGTPGVQRRNRAINGKSAFFSIAALLRSPTTPAPPSWEEETQPGPPKHPTLRLGAKHEAVRVLQRLLEPMYPGLIIDGQFGPQTAAVVMGFQRRAGLDADGIVGPKTWAALEKAK